VHRPAQDFWFSLARHDDRTEHMDRPLGARFEARSA
jgi:hypothetical protein